jgi:hypothetical protein
MRARKLCFVLLTAGVVVAACSSSAQPSAISGLGQDAPTYGEAAPAATPAGLNGISDGEAGGATAAPGAANATAAAAPAASLNAAAPESQIVKVGTISIQVTGLDDSVARATDQIHVLGGWLAGSDRTSTVAENTASVTYRIPAAKFEDALAVMRKLGVKILGEHTESTPVGGQIVDLQARIANLKASEKALQAIMDKATTITDILAVQQRLTDVQGQIEELSGQLAGLTDQATYSTLTVIFVVPVLASPSPSASPTPSPSPTATPIPWSAADQAGQAAGTLGEVGKATATALIWITIVVLPIAVAGFVLLVLLGFAGRIIDPYRKRLLPFTVSQPVAWTASPARPSDPSTQTGPEQRPEDRPRS